MKKTFIKMQSLSRKALLCGGLIAMAAALVGCSSDAPDPGADPNPGVAQTDGDPLTVISDQATLSGLVLNYENNSSEAPKAFTLPDAPAKSEYANAVNIKNVTDWSRPDDYKDGIIIPKGETFGNGEMKWIASSSSPLKIYIAGTLNCGLDPTSAIEVYILEGGEWINTKNFGQLADSAKVTIYDYNKGKDGGLTFAIDGEVTMKNCSYYGKEFNHPQKDFTFPKNSELYVEGAVIVDELKIIENALLNTNCLTAENVYLTNTSKHYVGSYIHAETMKFDSGARISLQPGAYVEAEGLFILKSTSGFDSPDGTAVIKVDDYYSSDNSGDGTLDETDKFTGFIDIYVDDVHHCRVEDKKVVIIKDVELNEITRKSNDIQFISDDDFKDSMKKSCPSGGSKPNPDPVNPNPNPNPGPKFPNNPVVIIEITGKDVHKHAISATCIDVVGDMAYVSWHERGGNIFGCIEGIKIDGDKATITSWMQTPEWICKSGTNGANAATAYDFNHIICDQSANALLTVGEHAKKGGIIGRIKLGKAFGENAELNILENRQLGVEEWDGNKYEFVAGRSGNCVVISPDGTKLLVASRGGYQVIPYGVDDPFAKGEDLKHLITSKMMKAVGTEGSAKHLALYGNQLVSIEYTVSSEKADWWEDNTTALDAKISLWDNWENFPNNPTHTIEVPAFSPVFGKDVIAMDASGIYSCQGHSGVAKYNASLKETNRFNVDAYMRAHRDKFTRDEIIAMTGAAANGLAVDNRYLYIAYGGAGLWVLDKGSFEVVGYYSAAAAKKYTYEGNEEPKKASANYVKVMADGKIFVAYGRDGVKVLKLPKKD